MKWFTDNQYHWLITHLPYRLMYVQRSIDSQHKMWFPRWGLSKKQIKDAEQRANELCDNLKDNWE